MNATSTPGIESRARTRSSAAASMSGLARDGSTKQRLMIRCTDWAGDNRDRILRIVSSPMPGSA